MWAGVDHKCYCGLCFTDTSGMVDNSTQTPRDQGNNKDEEVRVDGQKTADSGSEPESQQGSTWDWRSFWFLDVEKLHINPYSFYTSHLMVSNLYLTSNNQRLGSAGKIVSRYPGWIKVYQRCTTTMIISWKVSLRIQVSHHTLILGRVPAPPSHYQNIFIPILASTGPALWAHTAHILNSGDLFMQSK